VLKNVVEIMLVKKRKECTSWIATLDFDAKPFSNSMLSLQLLEQIK
jgi:hypothetical protein